MGAVVNNKGQKNGLLRRMRGEGCHTSDARDEGGGNVVLVHRQAAHNTRVVVHNRQVVERSLG